MTAFRVRVPAVLAAVLFLAVALGIRVVASRGGILDGSSALTQNSGTALYAATVYAGVFILAPRARPWAAGLIAVAFCWLIEFLQLTGIPATLSAHSVLARLALGEKFDPHDLLWYVIGILPLAALHEAARHLASRAGQETA